MQFKGYSGDVVVCLIGVVDCNVVEVMKGMVVFIFCKYFLVLDDNEFYWVDLIGLVVENFQGE